MRGVVVVLVAAAAFAATAQAGHARNHIVFVSDRADGIRELYVVNADGSGERRLTFNGIFERAPVWSPDGTRIAFAGLANGNWDVYTVGANGGDVSRVTRNPERDDYPQWTGDGRLVFQRGPADCPCTAWIVEANGAHERRLPLSGNVLTPAPSPHGSRLAYATDAAGSWSIHVAGLDGTHDRAITTGSPAYGDVNPRWSPTGNTIAFLRDQTGTDNDLYVVHSDGTGLRRLTDTPDRVEYWPSWTAAGAKLLFASIPAGGGNWRLRTISVADGSESTVSTRPSAPLADDFSGSERDASLWHVVSDPGSSVTEQNGRLEIGIAAGSPMTMPFNQVEAHFGSQCSLPGDYDLRVDYRLLDWPAGYYGALSAFFTNAFVARQDDPFAGAEYVAWIGGNGAFPQTADTSGTLRLVRSGDSVTGLIRSSGSSTWSRLYTGSAPGTAVYGIGLTAPGFWYPGGVTTAAASIAFDNFELTSGALECPEWWNDLAGDSD